MRFYYQLYRSGTLGTALIDSLDEFVQTGHMTPQLAMQVLDSFDKSISEALSKKVKAKAVMKGGLATYNHYEEVLTLVIKNSTLTCDHTTIALPDKTKIVACDGRRTSE
ncbi:Transcription initiation factor IIA subunit 2 [Coemansia aciculifera]|nr:Transcription initiation factor IIA subunit 2 [Coemansia aciculifera]